MRKLRLSLANKCQLLFGAAVVLILGAALAVVWVRMQTLVRDGQADTARRLADAWSTGLVQAEEPWWLTRPDGDDGTTGGPGAAGQSLVVVKKEDFDAARGRDPFVEEAIRLFETRPDKGQLDRADEDASGRPMYRYARAVRKSDLSRLRGGAAAGFAPALDAPGLANPLEMLLYIRLHSELRARQLLLNKVYIIAAGLLAGLLAIAVFWFITSKLILRPVRVLRETAEKVSEGDLNIRSDINTGDEFEQLSSAFNQMLESLKGTQDQLRGVNKSLDLKLGELAEANVSLYQADKMKGEFLANVSHELRTPLNSIIGFAEVLGETLKDRTGPMDEKRKRYASHIITSSRRLLDLINDLLDLAKIETGRMDVHVAPMSVADTAEGLVNLIRPQAEKREIELRLKVEPNVPLVQTDAGKFQQILFNFLSNAVKFTPAGGEVTLSAGMVPALGSETSAPAVAGTRVTAPDTGGAEATPRLRVSVTDSGPGVPLEQHERIFEKFTQLDSTVTKEYGGTGLGLTISRELAHLLQGQIYLDSDTGRGATFTLVIPLALATKGAPLMPTTEGAVTASALREPVAAGR